MFKIDSLFVHWKRVLAFSLVLVLMFCSMTILANTFTDPQTYSDTIESIDEKKVTVLRFPSSSYLCHITL